jgi:carbamoyl-phosphate synthase large subunit
MDSNSLRIAVTGLDIYGTRGPGVGVARAIRASDDFTGEIIGICYDTRKPGETGDGICSRTYYLPYPPESTFIDALRAKIEEIQNTTPVDVIVPTIDTEIVGFLSIACDLAKQGIALCLPKIDSVRLESKTGFNRICGELEISIPPEIEVRGPGGHGEEIRYPVILKSRFNTTAIALTPNVAEHQLRFCSCDWRFPVFMREFIVGDRYDAVALGDGNGGLIGAVPVKKILQGGRGKASAGATVSDPDILEFIRSIVEKLEWAGPCELKMLRRSSDGSLFLLQMKPGFPDWSYLSVGAGQNLPWAAVLLALGKRADPFPPCRPDLFFLKDAADIVYSDDDCREFPVRGEQDPVESPFGQARGAGK